jgi:hypothetical protein
MKLELKEEKEKTPEEERISMIKLAAKQNITKLAEEYMDSRDKALLQKIQDIVDVLDDAFVLVIGQKDGVNVSVTFNPKEPTPEVHSLESGKVEGAC